jgi:hypothetical protein
MDAARADLSERANLQRVCLCASFTAMTNSMRRTSARLRRRSKVGLCLVALALVLIPVASATSQIYWWQSNMSPGEIGYDRRGAYNHNYNELYFGSGYPNYDSEVWEVTPRGERHFDKRCRGNCFNDHPPYYSTYVYCANRDGVTHFVYDCFSAW